MHMPNKNESNFHLLIHLSFNVNLIREHLPCHLRRGMGAGYVILFNKFVLILFRKEIKTVKKILVLIMIGVFVTGYTAFIFAEEYPVKPITIVTGMMTGSMSDLTNRVIADEVKKSLGVEVLVQSKPGATGTVAVSFVISAPPDGYTLGGTSDGAFLRSPHRLKLNFNPIQDTLPIIIYAKFHNFLIVREDSPFKTFKGLIDFAKENPGKLKYGDTGIGTNLYLGFAGLALKHGFKFSYIPHDGDAAVSLSILGGHIMAGGLSSGPCVPLIRAGKIRLLAVVDGDKRLEAYPEVPTFSEFGDVIPSPGLLIFGQKGLPHAIAKKLEGAFSKASQSDIFKKFALGNEVYLLEKPIIDQNLQDFLKTEYKKTGELYKKLGL